MKQRGITFDIYIYVCFLLLSGPCANFLLKRILQHSLAKELVWKKVVSHIRWSWYKQLHCFPGWKNKKFPSSSLNFILFNEYISTIHPSSTLIIYKFQTFKYKNRAQNKNYIYTMHCIYHSYLLILLKGEMFFLNSFCIQFWK